MYRIVNDDILYQSENMEKRQPIECEVRAEIAMDDLCAIHEKLKSLSHDSNREKRLSVMFFGETSSEKPIDVRIRITNGRPEMVVKKGALHAADRTESSLSIDDDQFIDLVNIVSLFDFQEIKVGERSTTNYFLDDDCVASVVEAGPIAYLEVEKMCKTKTEANSINNQLKSLISRLPCRLLTNKKDFDGLCTRLSEKVDWRFTPNSRNLKRLSQKFNHHKVTRKNKAPTK